MTELLEPLRALNVFLLTAAALGVAIRLNDMWASATAGVRVIMLGVLLFPTVNAYGSIEQLAQGAPVGWRVPAVTVACSLVLAGLWISRHDEHQAR